MLNTRWTRLRRSAGSLLAAILLAGCAASGTVEFDQTLGPVAVTDTPFYPQQRYQCGPAALMTVLAQSGANVSLDELVESVYLPGRKGSLQSDIIASARAAERIPYRIDASFEGLLAELQAGRPVLVLQNLGIGWFPRWHYAVVYGFDPESGELWLRSGTEAHRPTRLEVFMRTWDRGDRWGIVVLRPDQLPATVDPQHYFRAVAAMEATGHAASARTAWATALERWPDEVTPLFGLANTELALGQFAAAQQHYRTLLLRDPQNAAARNNLAYALAAAGKIDEARTELELALRTPGLDSLMANELRASLADITTR
jgi:tetratricopeptide (TPR) repeat protein